MFCDFTTNWITLVRLGAPLSTGQASEFKIQRMFWFHVSKMTIDVGLGAGQQKTSARKLLIVAMANRWDGHSTDFLVRTQFYKNNKQNKEEQKGSKKIDNKKIIHLSSDNFVYSLWHSGHSWFIQPSSKQKLAVWLAFFWIIEKVDSQTTFT